MTFEVQDKYNASKIWVIRKAEDGGYEWNQKIDGNLFYDRFSGVELSWIARCLGDDTAKQVADALSGEPQPAEFEQTEKHGLDAGDNVEIWVNQGMRDAVVLGTHDDLAIAEYEMPAGTTALTVLPRDGGKNWGKSVSYRTCPKYWIKAIREGVNGWEGRSQTGKTYEFPKEEK